jgi:hypothetical protein
LLNLAYRWFCRLDLEERIPHDSTFSEKRLVRFRESDVLRHVFERVVQAGMVRGLVRGEGFAVDASVIEADGSRYHGVAPDEIDWTDEQRQRRAVREYLEAIDETAPDPVRKTPKVISPSDPASAWTAKANKRVQFGYGLNYLIDCENAIIVDVEATPARTYDEVAATRGMLERTRERRGLKPQRLAADSACGTGAFLAWLIRQKIAPHITIRDLSALKDGTFSRADFFFDPGRDQFTCPGGKLLKQYRRNFATSRSGVTKNGMRPYRASKLDCQACPLKPRCCPNASARKVPRHIHVRRAPLDTSPRPSATLRLTEGHTWCIFAPPPQLALPAAQVGDYCSAVLTSAMSSTRRNGCIPQFRRSPRSRRATPSRPTGLTSVKSARSCIRSGSRAPSWMP